jgi:uncharacterized phiE125 gp8 family phage protein
MPLSFQETTQPAAEPVTLALAKLHAHVDTDDEDLLFEAWITAARQYCERYTRRAFFNREVTRTLDYFPLWYGENGTVNPADRQDWPYYASFWDKLTIDLPLPRCVSVTSITYTDTNGTTQTLPQSAYNVDVTSLPARIVPSAGNYWPTVVTYQPGSVQINYVAGSYGDGVEVNTIPQGIVVAMILLIGHWYRNREASSELALKNIPLGVNALLDPYKLHLFEYR